MRYFGSAVLFLLVAALISGGCQSAGEKAPAAPPTPRDQLEQKALRLQQAVQAAPDDAEMHYQLGNALFDLAQYAAAEKAYRRATELKPDYAAAYCNLGLSLRLQGRADEAIKAYEQALEIEPDDITTLNNVVAVLRGLGELEGVIEYLKRLAEMQPDDAAIHSEIANLLFRRGRYADAVAYYKRVIELDPGMSADYYNLGLCYLELDDLDTALTTWLTALAFDSKNASARKGLAVVYWRRGEFDKAWQTVIDCQTRGIPLDAEFIARLQEDSGRAGPEL